MSYSKFATVSCENWCETLFCSADNPDKFIGVLPGFPDEQTQIGMVGSSGRHTLTEMSLFYKELNNSARNINFTFDANTRVADFGCGFGRLTRFFIKDTQGENIFGLDCTRDFIEICHSTFPETCIPRNNFVINSPLPPLNFPAASFDIITAYSVFTHLAEHASSAWISEFSRVLKPGGLFVFTLRQKQYLEYCSQIGNQEISSDYRKNEFLAFGNYAERIQQYTRGEYMYYPSGGGDYLSNDFYGDTVVPPAYVRKHWCKDFNLIEMFDDMSRVSQAFVVLQKK